MHIYHFLKMLYQLLYKKILEVKMYVAKLTQAIFIFHV